MKAAFRQRQRPDPLTGRAKIALATAGSTGGSAGSPRPVGGLLVCDDNALRCPAPGSCGAADTGGSCSARRGPSSVISWPSAGEAVDDARPAPGSRRCSGLMIWLPMSPATQTLFTFTVPSARDRHLGDLGEVAAVAEVEGDAHARALAAACVLPQPDFSRDQLEHAAHARRVEIRGGRRPGLHPCASGAFEQMSSRNCSGILAGRVRELVDERLDRRRRAVAAAARAARRSARRAASATRRARSSGRSARELGSALDDVAPRGGELARPSP